MIRTLSLMIALSVPFLAHAQKAPRPRQEAMRCAAAAIALSNISKIPDEIAKYKKKADGFLAPVIRENERENISSEQFEVEVRTANLTYQSQLEKLGGSTDQMVIAYEEVEDCGG